MAKYHVRVPYKAKAVFRFESLPNNGEMDELLRQKFDEGKYILSCEELFPSDRQVVLVCEEAECGVELTPEEAETGICDECYQKLQRQQAAERKHPDE